MPLSILMVCPEFSPKLGGTEIQALNLSIALKSKGVEVSILTRMSEKIWKRHETIEGLSVNRVDYPRIRWVGGLLLNTGLSWEIMKNHKKIDVLHFHIGGSHMLLPLMLARILGKPSLLKISGWWEMDKGFLRPIGLIPGLMRKLLFKCDAIIAVSLEIRERLIALGYPAQRIVSLSNGVDTCRFSPVKKAEHKPAIIFVGRLVTEKGVPNLLMAVDKLRAQFPDIQLKLVGAGRDEENLKQMSSRLGLNAHVIFHGRMDDVSTALSSSDIYVQPSMSEGLPNSLLEAMACGLPVVITRVGGMPDVVADGVHGFVVSPGNVDELAQALGKLLGNESLRHKLGAAGSAKIQHELSLDAISDKYIAQYQILVNG